MNRHACMILIVSVVASAGLWSCRSPGDGDPPAATPAHEGPAGEGSAAAAEQHDAPPDGTDSVALDPVQGHLITEWEDGTLIVYCGIDRVVMEPLFARFTDETGIPVQVVYESTPALFDLTISLFEDAPVDVFIGDNQVDLHELATSQGFLIEIDPALRALVHESWQEREGRWVGLYGSLMGYAWRTDRFEPDELPIHYLDIGQERFRGRVGWYARSPSTSRYLAWMRAGEGDAAAEMWFNAMLDNEAKEYSTNQALYQALVDGEIDLALALNTEVMKIHEMHGEVPIAHHRIDDGGPASMVLASAIGVTRVSYRSRAGMRLIEFLLSEDVQHTFSETLGAVPLAIDVEPADGIPALSELLPPFVDLGSMRPEWELMELLARVRTERSMAE